MNDADNLEMVVSGNRGGRNFHRVGFLHPIPALISRTNDMGFGLRRHIDEHEAEPGFWIFDVFDVEMDFDLIDVFLRVEDRAGKNFHRHEAIADFGFVFRPIALNEFVGVEPKQKNVEAFKLQGFLERGDQQVIKIDAGIDGAIIRIREIVIDASI